MWLIPLDKILHFSVSFVLATTLSAYRPKDEAAKMTAAIGIGKEVYDYCTTRVLDPGDVLADAAGILWARIVLDKMERSDEIEICN